MQLIKRPGQFQSESKNTTQQLFKNGVFQSEGECELAYKESGCQGYNISGFKKLKRKGILTPFTPWKQWSVVQLGIPSEHIVTYSNGDVWARRNYVHPYVFEATKRNAVGLEGDLDLSGVSAFGHVGAAAATIYGSGADMLTFVAELKQTFRMLSSAYGNLRRLLMGRRSIADSWLEYRYGWRVLFFEIRGIAEALAMLETKRTRYMQRSGHSVTNCSTVKEYFSNPYYSYNIVSDVTVNVSARGVVVADIEPPAFRFDPIKTSWELVKYSWIIDWFVDIGGWVDRLRFLQFASQHYAAMGYKITTHINARCEPLVNYGKVVSNVMSSESITRGELIVRQPCAVPVLPTLGTGLNLARAIDALAVLAQSVLRRR